MDFFKIMFYGGGGEGVSVAIFYDRKKQQGIFNFLEMNGLFLHIIKSLTVVGHFTTSFLR